MRSCGYADNRNNKLRMNADIIQSEDCLLNKFTELNYHLKTAFFTVIYLKTAVECINKNSGFKSI